MLVMVNAVGALPVHVRIHIKPPFQVLPRTRKVPIHALLLSSRLDTNLPVGCRALLLPLGALMLREPWTASIFRYRYRVPEAAERARSASELL